ncbi:MAG TPA: hypothetical protein ENK05_07670 [Gammaproteobacteria bacterium]|nr:hypothetical protein [Gammaproteobacteria bacterium]
MRHAALVLLAVVAVGCTSDQVHESALYKEISLPPGKLEQHGIGFITPSTVTGLEQDTQNLAFIFAKVLREERPDIRVVSLPETLSAVNRAGIADEYKGMYTDYRDTGIFKRESLRRIGEVTGVRYLVQLKLSSFGQQSRGRFSLLGLRLFQTKEASVRLFLQIWDSQAGTIVWEGSEELNYAWDTSREKPVTFRLVVEEVARNLIGKLPRADANAEAADAG